MDINNREDEEDSDLSGLLQLAESQRQDQDYVVRGGNCTLEREVLTSSWSPRSHPSYGALIQVLDFTHLHYIISDKFLTHLVPHTRNLLELYINSPKQLSDESLIALATSAPALRRLELVDCPKITDNGMSSILDHCHAIQHLVVSNGGASCLITDKSLSHLAHSTASQRTLRVLNLSNASPFITGQNPGLLSLAIWCRHLISLNISHCSKMITDDFLEALRFGGSLQILNLAYCRDVTDRGIIAMARSCPDLRELDIAGVNLITDKGILEIGLRCSLFQRLVIDDRFEQVTEDVLRCFPWGAEVVQQRRMPI
ncbi:hypothetical protein BGZ98_007769 [Dissophora globulifera]|nr:hypothetical protein BGZ98_007769 [Dissophora globulifera]